MAAVVDPSPLIEEKLRALAAEHEPRIAALERRVAEADRAARRAAKAELQSSRRAYAAERRAVEKLRGPWISW
jgi:hypothetical protein